MTDITTAKFTDLLSEIIDNRGRTCPTAESGFPLIATNCIKDDALYPKFENVRYVDNETRSHWFRGHPAPGDIIFVCKGSPGRAALTPDPVPFCIAQDMVSLRADPAIIDNIYLYYLLQWRNIRKKIENMHVGTMIPHFKKGDFQNLNLPIHTNLRTQKNIGSFLFSLDDKIATNSRISAICDELLTSLWIQQTADCPGVPLSSLAKFVNGRAFTKQASGTGRPVIRIAELNNGIGPSTVFNDIDVPDDHVARPGDLLMSWSGSLRLKQWHLNEGIINQHLFKIIPHAPNPLWAISCAIDQKLADFKSIARSKATTMGHIQRRHLDELVPWPNLNENLSAQAENLWERGFVAARESETLAATRDELLPLLMSGKITVKDAEKRVEDEV